MLLIQFNGNDCKALCFFHHRTFSPALAQGERVGGVEDTGWGVRGIKDGMYTSMSQQQLEFSQSSVNNSSLASNMFIRISTVLFSVVAFAGVASAIPSALKVRNGGSSSSCDTGSIQCCDSTQSVSVLSLDAGGSE